MSLVRLEELEALIESLEVPETQVSKLRAVRALLQVAKQEAFEAKNPALGRLSDEQVVEFAAKVCETAKVFIWDRVTRGPAVMIEQVFNPQDIRSELTEFRKEMR